MEELDTIIKSITDNLTGVSQKDIKYLQGCIELTIPCTGRSAGPAASCCTN